MNGPNGFEYHLSIDGRSDSMPMRNKSLRNNYIHKLRIDCPSHVVEVTMVLVVRRNFLFKASKSTTQIHACSNMVLKL